MYNPSFETFAQRAKEGNLIPIYKEILADTETPVTALMKLRSKSYAFLLESVEGGEKWGRYTFLGSDPTTIMKIK
jgi:anthranilate synthase component 1